jgi:hypothetical protein
LGTHHLSITTASRFEQLVRFANPSGRIFYGEFGVQNTTPAKEDVIGRKIRVYQEGKLPWDEQFKLTEVEEEIAEVRVTFSKIFQTRY